MLCRCIIIQYILEAAWKDQAWFFKAWIMISSDPYNPGLKPAVLVCVCILPRPFISKRQKRKVVLVLIHKAGFLKKYFQVY